MFDPTKLYRTISDEIMLAFMTQWPRSDVPVLWRDNDPLPHPDPIYGPVGRNGRGARHFLRNELDFGAEGVAEVAGGRGRNIRAQYGSLIMRVFSSIMLENENEALELASIASNIFRDYRMIDANGCQLIFLESGTGLEWAPTEDGVWFMRALLAVFEYRFPEFTAAANSGVGLEDASGGWGLEDGSGGWLYA